MVTLIVHRASPAIRRGYHDAFIIKGREFKGSAVPWLTKNPHPVGTPAGKDVNGDGVADVTMLPPGEYVAEPGDPIGKRPAWNILTAGGDVSVPVWPTDRTNPKPGDDYTSDAFKLHVGDAIPALGCLIVAPADYARFVAALGGAEASIRVLVLDEGAA